MEVTKKPKEEKKEYDFSGPVNDGLTMTGQEETATTTIAPTPSTAATATGTQPSSGPIVVLTHGHTSSGTDGYEPLAPETVGYAAQSLVLPFIVDSYISNTYEVTTFEIIDPKTLTDTDTFPFNGNSYKKKDIAMAICETNKCPTRNKLISTLKSLGLIYSVKANKSSSDPELFSFSFVKGNVFGQARFYKTKKGKTFEKKLLTRLYDTSSSKKYDKKLREWAEAYCWKNGSHHTIPSSFKKNQDDYGFFKTRGNAGGASYKGIPEYEANFEIVKALQNRLVQDGYTVVVTRSDADDPKVNGLEYSNRNIALAGNDIAGAVVHFVIHCDSDDSTTENLQGIHILRSSTGVNKDAKKQSKKIYDAMLEADKNEKITVYKNENMKKTIKEGKKWDDGETVKIVNTDRCKDGTTDYTAPNWQGIPTLYVECAYMTKYDFGHYVKENGNKKEFYADAWLEGRYQIFKAGIDKAIELAQ